MEPNNKTPREPDSLEIIRTLWGRGDQERPKEGGGRKKERKKERKSRQKTGIQKLRFTLFHILAFKSLGSLSTLHFLKVLRVHILIIFIMIEKFQNLSCVSAMLKIVSVCKKICNKLFILTISKLCKSLYGKCRVILFFLPA